MGWSARLLWDWAAAHGAVFETPLWSVPKRIGQKEGVPSPIKLLIWVSRFYSNHSNYFFITVLTRRNWHQNAIGSSQLPELPSKGQGKRKEQGAGS